MSKNASWPRASTAFRASPSACGNCSRRSDRSSTSQRSDAVSEFRRVVSREARAMNRRAFVTGLGAVLAAPLAAEAQRPGGSTQRPGGKLPRVGYLAAGPSLDRFGSPCLIEAFREGLRESGYVEGQSVTIEFKF